MAGDGSGGLFSLCRDKRELAGGDSGARPARLSTCRGCRGLDMMERRRRPRLNATDAPPTTWRVKMAEAISDHRSTDVSRGNFSELSQSAIFPISDR